MTEAEVSKLAQMFALYAGYYRLTVDDRVLRMYAEDLADLSFNEVSMWLDKYRKDPKNRTLPMPAQIRDMIQPSLDPDSTAREISARISGAVVRFGYSNPAAAREFIGDLGWGIIDRRGGWNHLCSNLGITIDPTVFEAQLREQIKSVAKYGQEIITAALNPSPNQDMLKLVQATIKPVDDQH